MLERFIKTSWLIPSSKTVRWTLENCSHLISMQFLQKPEAQSRPALRQITGRERPAELRQRRAAGASTITRAEPIADLATSRAACMRLAPLAEIASSVRPGERGMVAGCPDWNGGGMVALRTTVSTLPTCNVTEFSSLILTKSLAVWGVVAPRIQRT